MAQQATRSSLEVEPGTRWKYTNNDTMLVQKDSRHDEENEEDKNHV